MEGVFLVGNCYLPNVEDINKIPMYFEELPPPRLFLLYLSCAFLPPPPQPHLVVQKGFPTLLLLCYEVIFRLVIAFVLMLDINVYDGYRMLLVSMAKDCSHLNE